MSYNLYSSKTRGLDNRVWLTMLLVLFMATGFLGYSYISTSTCRPVSVMLNNKNVQEKNIFYVGDVITMRAITGAENRIDWSFGDDSEKQSGIVVSHKYNSTGHYRLKAVINGNCEEIVEIKIIEQFKAGSKNTFSSLYIIAKDNPVVGEAVSFSCITPADHFRWEVIDDKSIKPIEDSVAVFTFDKARKYTVQLTLDRDPAKQTYTTIYVSDKASGESQQSQPLPKNYDFNPQPTFDPSLYKKENDKAEKQSKNKPADEPVVQNPLGQPNVAPKKDAATPVEEKPKKKPMVTNESFKGFLQEVIDKKANPDELAERYLMYGNETKVELSGDMKGRPRFLDFCYDMRGKNNYTIESVTLQRDENEHVQLIHVKVKKGKNFFQKVLGKKN